MLSIYRNMFRIPDLRTKIVFTLAMFAVYRLGTTIPVPGIDLDAVRLWQGMQEAGGIYGLLNLFSGGALEQFSVFALGIIPYITASIIMQLLTVVIPRLRTLQEEGESGRKVITQWTRYLTVILALIQATGFTFLFHSGRFTAGIDLIPNYTPGRVILIVLTMTAGTAMVMWLGELITQRGVGNGMSLIIFVSILSQFPFIFGQLWSQTVAVGLPVRFVVIVAVFLAMIVSIIFIDQGQRRIPISFAKRVRGRRVLGGQSTYIPLKVNTSGVIPVIFATSVLLIPSLIITAIPSDAAWIQAIYRWINTNLGAGQAGVSWWYIAILFALIVFFTYFYTAIQFDPEQQAEMIQRQGGFIPGVRPGRQTARHLAHILNRITLPGSLFLATIAVLPAIAGAVWGIQIAFSGVSILIVVGVALETMKQIESQLTMRNYEGILT
ncbi:MAG: preprotein translocase subunit SecY [Actinobacteria bacterium]|nr:preprotein translocase subunit SecY [Actinomycetota bacterium]MCI0545110.1 preprotein translocase subunit SecY [Actinomycetota bacterium]MCI0677872.1 preprotein translocase subunit SecY [Actinomycetota bacterium]